MPTKHPRTRAEIMNQYAAVAAQLGDHVVAIAELEGKRDHLVAQCQRLKQEIALLPPEAVVRDEPEGSPS